jgi:hypothetical protein
LAFAWRLALALALKNLFAVDVVCSS